MSLACRHVRTEGEEEHGDEREDEEPQGRIAPDEPDAHEREARAGHRAEQVDRERLDGHAPVRTTLGDGDRRLNEDRAERHRQEGSGDRGDARRCGEPVRARRRESVEDRRGDARLECEERDVEHELGWPLPGPRRDRERDDRADDAPDDEVVRRSQEEPEHERNLAQREGVRVLAERQMDRRAARPGRRAVPGPTTRAAPAYRPAGALRRP